MPHQLWLIKALPQLSQTLCSSLSGDSRWFLDASEHLSAGRGTWLASKWQQSRDLFFRQDYDLGCYPFTAIGASIRVYH